jgi:hypothetical protein
VNDSITPLLIAGTDVRAFLADKSVLLVAADDLEQHQDHVAGFLLLVNLCARLYPKIHIVAPNAVAATCQALALRINPACEFTIGTAPTSATLSWCCAAPSTDAILCGPSAWEVLLDLPDAGRLNKTNMLAALAAASFGAAALFRLVFREFLTHGRWGPEPARWNILTNDPTAPTPPDLPSNIPLGRIHLVGAGAVGQATAYALARVSATATITVVDPETISLPNLQRYVLSFDADEGVSKCAIIERELASTKIETVSVEANWSADGSENIGAQVICAAVDTAELRIALQAALPQRLYNAWTQPDDIGWSRHERFGLEPCAACLYWPTRPRPNYHELVARALRQHELRILAHLTFKVPVDVPLNPAQIPKLPNYPVPPEAEGWSSRTLLEDVATALEVQPSDLAIWKGLSLQDLYRDGICAGALIRKQVTDVPVEMAVPLAHQSALAGIMLATQLLVAAWPELQAYRPEAIESRLDLLATLPQITARPRQRTPKCLCNDSDFVARYHAKWPWATEA